MNKENIKVTLNTPGWLEILQLFDEEILTEKRRVKINTTKRFEDIAIDTIARAQAASIVDRVLSKLNKLASDIETKKESFK